MEWVRFLAQTFAFSPQIRQERGGRPRTERLKGTESGSQDVYVKEPSKSVVFFDGGHFPLYFRGIGSQKEKSLRPCVFPGFLKREEVLAGNGSSDLPETFLESPDGHGENT